MALRDELMPRKNKIDAVTDWIDNQENRDEWLDIIKDMQFSNYAISKLLKKYGHDCDHNVVYRIRQRHGLI